MQFPCPVPPSGLSITLFFLNLVFYTAPSVSFWLSCFLSHSPWVDIFHSFTIWLAIFPLSQHRLERSESEDMLVLYFTSFVLSPLFLCSIYQGFWVFLSLFLSCTSSFIHVFFLSFLRTFPVQFPSYSRIAVASNTRLFLCFHNRHTFSLSLLLDSKRPPSSSMLCCLYSFSVTLQSQQHWHSLLSPSAHATNLSCSHQ